MNGDEDHAEGTQTESSGGASAHPHLPGKQGASDPEVGELHDDATRGLREEGVESDTMGER